MSLRILQNNKALKLFIIRRFILVSLRILQNNKALKRLRTTSLQPLRFKNITK